MIIKLYFDKVVCVIKFCFDTIYLFYKDYILITVCTVVQYCCKGDPRKDREKGVFSPPPRLRLSTDRSKIWYSWLRKGRHPRKKIWERSGERGLLPICVKLRRFFNVFFSLFSFLLISTGRMPGPIFTINGSFDRVWTKEVPFGG